MAARSRSSLRRVADVGMVVVWAAVLARTLVAAPAAQWAWYVAGFAAFLVILVVAIARPLPLPLLHVAFAVQAAVVLLLLVKDPRLDYVTSLFALQCYAAAVVFPAGQRIAWVASLVALTGVSLALENGLVEGLAQALVTMAAGVVLAMFVVVTQELEDARGVSEDMVAELRAAQERLRVYAGQADELAALEQRSRVAGELGGSVAQAVASALDASAAARGLLAEPEQAVLQLERLQAQAKEALAEMRRVITELRPAQD